MTAAKSTFNSAYRRNQDSTVGFDSEEAESAHSDRDIWRNEPYQKLLASAQLSKVIKAMRSALGRKPVDVVLLKNYGFTEREIAKELRLSSNTVNRYFNRAADFLKRRVGEEK